MLDHVSGSNTQPSVTIIASDYDSTVIDNLRHNIMCNAPFAGHVSVSAAALDWQLFLQITRVALPSNTSGITVLDPSDPTSNLSTSQSQEKFALSDTPVQGAAARQKHAEYDISAALPTTKVPFDEPFDVILGADIVYEPHQALWIKETVTALLRRPSSAHTPSTQPAPSVANDARFHLVIPLRPTHEYESASVFSAFPRLSAYQSSSSAQSSTPITPAGLGPSITNKARQAPSDEDSREEDHPQGQEARLALVMLDSEEIEGNDRRRPMKYLRCEIGWAWV
ncbi:hypothetical protein DL93DRAFT_2075858, partial [Clavulina sp. PMI_390]